MHPYNVIRRATAYNMGCSNVSTVIEIIRSLKYNGGYPAFQYTSYIHNPLDQLHLRDPYTHEAI